MTKNLRLYPGWFSLLLAAVILFHGAAAFAQEVGTGPQMAAPPEFTTRQLYAPVVEGNPPPRVDHPELRFDSFLPTRELWPRIEECQRLVTLALKRPDRNRGFYLGEAYISETEFITEKEGILGLGLDIQDVTLGFSDSGFLPGPQKEFRPLAVLKVENEASVEALRSDPRVDYLEPYCANGIQFFFGCYGTTQSGVATLPEPPDTDVRERSFQSTNGDVVPWSYVELGVPTAWANLAARGVNPGGGVTVGVVDTGLTLGDPEMGMSFAATKGVGPTLDFSTDFTSPADVCDHGTRMAAVAVAPENGASIVGIAKSSGLFASRIGDSVAHFNPPWPLGSLPSRVQIGLAVERASAASTVVTLAWGMFFGSQAIADSITTATAGTQAVLLAAAGTFLPLNASFFPATMKNEVVGVTAIAPRRGTPRDFVRLPPGQVSYNDTVDVLGVASIDNEAGPSLGLNVGQLSRFGGSSSATAQLAGVFALSASAFSQANGGIRPTREQLISRVLSFTHQAERLPSETFKNGRSDAVGVGLVNSFAAVGGLVGVGIRGPRNVSAGVPFTLAAQPVGDGPFAFEWRFDGQPAVVSTSASITIAIPGGTTSRLVQVRVTVGGVVRSAEARIFAGGTRRRVLFSSSMVVAFASFFDGRRLDQVVNSGLRFPEGCSVVSTDGQEYVRNTSGQIVPLGVPVSVMNWPNRGFTITRPALATAVNSPIRPNDMDVHVHAWHDGVSAIRVRPVYLLDEPIGVDCRNAFVQEQP